MKQGELIVTGTNQITIPLDGLPMEVQCHFKDESFAPVPCDPGNVDYLSYDIHVSNKNHGGFVLIISWSVSSVREIKWKVEF